MKHNKKYLILMILTLFITALFTGCAEKPKEPEKVLTYKQTFVEEANLVLIDNYWVGKGKFDEITRYRFQVEKDGQKSADIDVSDLHCKIIYIEDQPDKKDKLGKVLAYKREYSDGVTRFAYELYVSKDKVKDLGELEQVDMSSPTN